MARFFKTFGPPLLLLIIVKCGSAEYYRYEGQLAPSPSGGRRTSFDQIQNVIDISDDSGFTSQKAFFPSSSSSAISHISSSVEQLWGELGNKRPYWKPHREHNAAVNAHVAPLVPISSVEEEEEDTSLQEKKDHQGRTSDWTSSYEPAVDSRRRRFHNRHRQRYQERNRQRRRRLRNQRKRLRNKSESTSCDDGTCRNMLGCMFSGLRVDWEVDSCTGMMGVCCKRWNLPKRSRRHKSKKSGRALSLFSPYTDSVPHEDPIFNSITGSGGPYVEPPYETDASYYTCGISKNAQRKIMGGLDAGYGQFPWTAHIKIRGPGIDKVCGGTLIDRKWVLTAGHCTQYCLTPACTAEIAQYDIVYKVVLGEYDMLSKEEYVPESYLVSQVFRHPEYRNVMRYRTNGAIESEPRFDVALMLLERPVRPAPNVAPICLPQEGATAIPSPGTLATVVGWGRLGREEYAPHSNVLQAATVPILSDYGCQIQTGLGVYSDQLCAGGSYAEQSACPGDSGGGLQVQDDHDRWTLIGIVSNGPSVCGVQPVIFHKVAHTLDWVRKTMHDWTYQSSREP